MAPKNERLEMRLDGETLERVDAWRGRQRDVPSRSEAIRRLIENSLASDDPEKILLSAGENLTLLMLGEIYDKLRIEGEYDPDFISAAIYGGHYWGLKWKYGGLFHQHVDEDSAVTEVVDILDMWRFLESAYNKLSDEEKERVKAEGQPFGEAISFWGFDGNNEGEYMGIAAFLIGKLDRFTSFAGREHLNSHMPTLVRYRRMVEAFSPIRAKLVGREMNVSEIVTVMLARRAPPAANL